MDATTELLETLTRQAPAPDATLAYGPAPEQFGDLRLPLMEVAGLGPYPLVIVIHGGYWRARYGLDYFGAACGALGRAGLATWNIEYRRIGNEGGGWPGTFEDVAVAADFARTLAREYPIDLSNVVTLGHSAGGHLALWLAARRRLAEGSTLWALDALPIAGAVSLGGVVDLRRAWELGLSDNVTETLLGATPDQAPERYRMASPIEALPLGLRQTLIHGTLDDNVPIELSERYVERARAAGDEVEFIAQEGAGHFEQVNPASAEWHDVERWVVTLAKGKVTL